MVDKTNTKKSYLKFHLKGLNKAMLNIIFIPAQLLLIFISFFLYYQFNNLLVSNNWVIHTEEVIKKTDAALFEMTNIESQQRAFLITGDYQYLTDIDESKINLQENLTHLKKLTRDNPEQNKRLQLFNNLIEQRLLLIEQIAKLKREDKFNNQEGLNDFKHSQEISTRVKDLGKEIKAVESVLLQERSVTALNKAKSTNLILIFGSSISLPLLLLAFILANSELTIRQKSEIRNKKSELQLRSIIESATDMIAAIDREGFFIIFNQAYQREFKHLFHKSITAGMSITEAFQNTQMDKKKLASSWSNFNEINQTIELMVDNVNVVYEMTISHIQNEEGEVEGSVHIIRNISKRIHEHNELQHSYQSLAAGMAMLENKNKQITLLVEMSEIMLACSSPDELSTVMSKYSSRMLGFAKGFLYMMHPSKNYLEISAKWGEALSSSETFTPESCWAIRRGRLHQVNLNHEELICDHITHFDQIDITLCVPLMAQNDIYGMLYLEIDNNEKEQLNEHKLLINAFAELTALAFANVRLRENLRYQSIRDPLTGLYNRRYLEDFLFKQIHQATRTKTCLSVLMLDLDHFKKLNDTYGHDAGDLALKECAKILQNDIRMSDIAARYGGEEFILILYGSNAESSLVRAKSILHAISMIQIRYGAQLLSALTISIGIADFPNDEQTMEALIDAADRALYRAKNNGRNQVMLASKMNDQVIE